MSQLCAQSNLRILPSRSFAARAVAISMLFGTSILPQAANAHAIAGDRVFPATLAIDDPSVASEVSLPTVDWFPDPRDASGDVPNETDVGAELDLVLLPNLQWAFLTNGRLKPSSTGPGAMGTKTLSCLGNICFSKMTTTRC